MIWMTPVASNWFSSSLRTVSPLFVNCRNGIRIRIRFRIRFRIVVFRSCQIKKTERTFFVVHTRNTRNTRNTRKRTQSFTPVAVQYQSTRVVVQKTPSMRSAWRASFGSSSGGSFLHISKGSKRCKAGSGLLKRNTG